MMESPENATSEAQHLMPSASEGDLSVNYLSFYDDEGYDEGFDEDYIRTASEQPSEAVDLPLWKIASILSTAFSYGCVFTTLFLITLPIECERLNIEHPSIPKSVALGIFVAIAGLTQLITPLVGQLSDTYVPPKPRELGQRLPYLVLGAILTCLGLFGQLFASYGGFWLRYSFFFFMHMIGLNIVYAMMISLIPDQVPANQTGAANGALALLLVTGALSGFGLYTTVLSDHIQYMYMLYIVIVMISTLLTCVVAQEKDAELAYQRNRRRYKHKLFSERLVESPKRESKQQWHEKASKLVGEAAQRVVRTAKDIVLTPTLLIKTMVLDPLRKLDWVTFLKAYTIDTELHHDFFVVTVSRLFYYCGMSIQTFFLYFLHDVIGIRDHPEQAVATLAVLGQCSAAAVCFPIGVLSDRFFGGRRKPFVFAACALLFGTMVATMFARTWDQMIYLSLVLGAANGIYLTMETSLAVDSLPKETESGNSMGEESSAQLLGIWGVAAFLGSTLGPMIGGPLLYLVGQSDKVDIEDSDRMSEMYSIAGYRVLLSLSALYFLCSALALRYIKRQER